MSSRLCLVLILFPGLSLSQAPIAPQAKPLAFEVVSIRQNVSAGKRDSFGPTPDGFRMTNASLARLIATAYVPQSGAAYFMEPKGFPAWVGSDKFDIEARVPQADLPQWQNSELQPAMLRAMLQQLLAERFHLAVHREFKELPVYYLEVGKAPKLKQTEAGEPYPNGQESRFPGGGIFVREGDSLHFYRAPMVLLATMLTNRNLGGRPVLDRTGLTGRYDFVVPWGAWTGGVSASNDASDPGPTLSSAVEALGLKLVPAKGQVENLVFDHVEHLSEN